MFMLQVLMTVQQDDITNATVSCIVFKIAFFHSLIFH